MSAALLQRFARNNAWSSHRLLTACAKLGDEEWDAPRTSFFPSLPATLNHILIVDWYYLDALTAGGKGRSVFANEIPCPRFEDLAKAQREADRALVAFAESQDDASLSRKISLERDDHVQVETVGDTLAHLFTHQIHHRGQAHAMLSGTSVSPPQLDEFFMREELPLRRQELEELGLPLE